MTHKNAEWKTYSEFVLGDYKVRVDKDDLSQSGDHYNVMVYFDGSYLDHDFCKGEDMAKARGLEMAFSHQTRQIGKNK